MSCLFNTLKISTSDFSFYVNIKLFIFKKICFLISHFYFEENKFSYIKIILK